MAAQLAVDLKLSLEDSLALVAAVSRLPDTWSITIRDPSPQGPALQLSVAGPGFVTVGGVRREAVAQDAIMLMSLEFERRGV
jgi:hypothetical protein